MDIVEGIFLMEPLMLSGLEVLHVDFPDEGMYKHAPADTSLTDTLPSTCFAQFNAQYFWPLAA